MHQTLDQTEAEILIVYQKEPHPGQMAFRDIAQPETFEQRCQLAARMKDEYEMPMTVLVDSMEDQSRDLFSDLPSPVYILNKDGKVTHKFPWPDQEQIADAIASNADSKKDAPKVKTKPNSSRVASR